MGIVNKNIQGVPKRRTPSLSIELFKFKIPSTDVMSTKFQTLCRKPRSIRMSSFEDMSDYVTEFKNTFIQ